MSKYIMEKSLKVNHKTNELIDTAVSALKRRFPLAKHINKKGVMATAIQRYYEFLLEEFKKKEEHQEE